MTAYSMDLHQRPEKDCDSGDGYQGGRRKVLSQPVLGPQLEATPP